MKSMTGFGRAALQTPDARLVIEVEASSVNRKNLDLVLNAPREWTGFDRRCHEWVRDRFQRGRLQLQVKLRETTRDPDGFGWESDLLKRHLERLRRFAEAENIPFEPDAALLLELAKILKDSSSIPDWRELEPTLQSVVGSALEALDTMRDEEGGHLAADISARIGSLLRLTGEIERSGTGAAGQYRANLTTRLKQAGLELELRDERVLKEIALFADRCDISEEVTRLRSHCEQFGDLVRSREPIGRKMDFLCQEIYRELNTCGSKSSRVDLTRAVIEAKNELERIREQVQNVE